MQRLTKSAVAGLMVSAVLLMPTAALAVTEESAPTAPAEAPAKPASEGLVGIKISRDEAIATAKRYFAIPADLGEPNVSTQQSQSGASWSLEWRSSSKSAERVYISVGVDAVTGTVREYSYSKNDPNAALQLSYTREEALAVAEEWLAKLAPTEIRQALTMVESPLNFSYYGGSGYQFRWMRTAGEYGMAFDGVSITVDARSGQLTNYSLQWQPDLDLTMPAKVLTRAEAEAAYQKQPLVLQYVQFAKRGTDEREWRLVYQPLTDRFMEMDQEGNYLDWTGKPIDLTKLNQFRMVEAGQKQYVAPAKPLAQAEALAVAKAVAGQTAEPNSSNYSEYGDDQKRMVWDFGWVIEQSDEQGTEPARPRSEMRVQIDAATGLVIEFYNWGDQRPFEKGEKLPVSLEQAREKAVAFVQTFRPDLAGSVRMRLSEPNWPGERDFQPITYSIPFQLLQNGLPVAGRELQVSVDARTGEIRNFWVGQPESTEQFPSPAAAISAEAAMNTFMEQQGIELTWYLFQNESSTSARQIELIWAPSVRLPIQSIDALTGAVLDWQGRDLIEATRRPADIAGHFAQREIELLWARGVFDLKDGKFNPDQTASAEELARWIVLSRGLRPFMAYDFAGAAGLPSRAAMALEKSESSAYFGAALQSGIILPEDFAGMADLSGPVSRELFALWAARTMGYARIATMDARIEMNFADKEQIQPKYANAVAILGGLRIVSGDSAGNFNPQGSLTRGEAAKILFATTVQR